MRKTSICNAYSPMYWSTVCSWPSMCRFQKHLVVLVATQFTLVCTVSTLPCSWYTLFTYLIQTLQRSATTQSCSRCSADTEGSFMLERVIQMTEACIADLVHASPANSKVQLNVEEVLGHIYLIRVHDPAEQLAVVNTLPKLLEKYPQVRQRCTCRTICSLEFRVGLRA